MFSRLILIPVFLGMPFLAPAHQPHRAYDPTVFVLLANNHLVSVHGLTGTVISDRALAPAPVPTWRRFRGYYVALSKDHKSVYALVLNQPPARDYLAVIDAATAHLQRRWALNTGVVLRSIAVGPVSGRIYLFGNRAGDVVVTVLDPHTRATVSTWTVRRGHGVHWVIYRGIVRRDERALFINYWRGEAYGMDAIALLAGRLRACHTVQVGCFASGGFNVEQYGSFLVTSSWTVDKTFVELTATGATVRTIPIHMVGDQHTGDWNIDPATGRLYQVGSCGYTGGLAVLDLNSKRSGMLVSLGTPGPGNPVTGRNDHTVCGERISVGSRSLVAVGKTEFVYPVLQHRSILLLLDGRSGRVLRRVELPTDPMDLLTS